MGLDLCFRCNPGKVKRSLTNRCRINITKHWTESQLVRYLFYLLWIETKRVYHLPSKISVSFKSIEREKIFSTFLAFALDLRFQIRERIPISTIFRRRAFEFFAETGRFRNEIRKKAKTVWIKSFLPDMLHQLRTLGRVREESRASAFKRMVGRKGGSGHSRVAPFKAWNGLAGIRLINNENEKTRE